MYRPGIGEVELPNEIERALEEQRLVFFCGAGVSVYTGLPLFRGLVEDVFRNTYRPIDELSGDDLEPAQAAFSAGQYDRALGLLEQALTPGTMRRAVIAELGKQYVGQLTLHRAILELARVPEGGYHLVTTNFDTRFREAGLDEKWVHDAPRLAPPRPHDWHYTTYLHGRIKDDDPEGRHLVLTSADFGRAYLQDGWAARFVVELFREFTVLFIGYSVEDPVMSYLVDALAAHRRYSQQFRTAFALVGFNDGVPRDRDTRIRDWQAKSIEPITFPKAGPNDYSAMNDALVAWADDHRLGLQSRINTALRATKQAYLQRDKEAEQVVWALSKHDGSVAKAFATAEPAADASWLKAFEEIDIAQADGQRLKLTSFPSVTANDKWQLGRGSPLAGSAFDQYASNQLSLVTHHIGVWISRHLDRKEVVQWITHQRGILHPEFASIIAWRLRQADYQICELTRRFWFILLTTTRRSVDSVYDLSGFTKILPIYSQIYGRVVVEAMRPTLTIAPSFGSWFGERESVQRQVRDLADIEINVNDEHGIIVDEKNLAEDCLVELADDFTSLLAEALQLGRLADRVEASGHSHWEIRSIAEHPAPSEHLDRWTVLVTLARDAFIALHKHDRKAAQALFQRWVTLARRPGCGLFLRLALFAAARAEGLPPGDLVEALLADHAAALWSTELEAELAGFFRMQGGALQRTRSTEVPTELADLLTADQINQSRAWSFFSIGDCVTGWLEQHPDKAIELFQALLERGEAGEGLASRVVAWLSDRRENSKVLTCLLALSESGKKDLDGHLTSSAARALKVLAESTDELDRGNSFWAIWSFVVEIAARSSKPCQPHEEDPLTDSLNAPGGYLAEGLLFKAQQDETGGTLGDELIEHLNLVAGGARDFHFLARTMLASRLPWLHSNAAQWTRDVLIKRMGFDGSALKSEARALWQGFLWAPRLNPKLLEDLKPAFLQALALDLEFRGDDNLFYLFADLLLKAPDKLSPDEQRSAFRDMPTDGLVACARYWRQVLQGAPKDTEGIWTEKIAPLIQAYWPVIRAKVTPETVEALALLAIQTKKAFPDAVDTLSNKKILMPLARSGLVLMQLAKKKEECTGDQYDYVAHHARKSVELIERSVDFGRLTFERRYLRDILSRALAADPSLEHAPEYISLQERTVS